MIPTKHRSLAWTLSLLSLVGCGSDEGSLVPPRDPDPIVAPPVPTPSPTPAPTPTPIEAGQGTAIGAPMPMGQLARAILQLKNPLDRAALAATSVDGINFQLVASPETDAIRVATLVTTLGSVSTSPVVWPPTAPLFTVELLEVRGAALPLYLAPTTRSEVVRILPDGAFFVAFVGTFATGASTREGATSWVYGQTSSGIAGWLQSARVAPEEGCVLPDDAIAGALSLQLDDPALSSAVVGNLRLYRGGQAKPGTFVITDSFLATIERGNCRTASLDTRIDLAVPVRAFHHARVTETGDTFLALGLEPQDGSDAVNWQFYLPRASEPALELSLRSLETVPSRDRDQVRFALRRGPANARGYWPFSVQHGREPAVFYVSDGTRFVDATAPAPAPAAPAPAPAPAAPAAAPAPAAQPAPSEPTATP